MDGSYSQGQFRKKATRRIEKKYQGQALACHFRTYFRRNRRYRFRGYRLDCHRFGDPTSERQSGFPYRMGASHGRPSPNTGSPRVYDRGSAPYNGGRQDASGAPGSIYKKPTRNREILTDIGEHRDMIKFALLSGGQSVNPEVGCLHRL